MGEVDDAEHAEDDRETERQQCQESTADQPVERVLQEIHHEAGAFRVKKGTADNA
ncbi:hypothetical protein GCM10009661_70590 [Catellatospora chokoriensis]